MSESLFLNKRKVDIYSKPITRRIQIGDVNEVTERKSSFSYTIKIPKTSNNLEVLEMLSTGGNTSLKPFEEIPADYIINNVYVIQNGIAVIRDSGKDFSVNLIDGFRGLANLLGDKRINEIDLSDLDHEINSEVMVQSYNNTEGYIYGFADFGKGIDDSVGQETEGQAPSIFVHTIISRIFDEAGFDLIGDFFTTDEKYLNEVITPSNGYEVSPAGTLVVMSDIIGDTKQIDLIKDIANRHGLLMKPNDDITGFEFKKFQEVLNSRNNADNWTKKVGDFKKENYTSGYAQINTANYDYADSNVNDLDGELLIENYVASPEKEIFKGVFQIPENIGIVGHSFELPSKEIFKIPIWGDYVQKEANIENEIDGDVLATPSRLKQDGTTEAFTGGRVERYDITYPSSKTFAIDGSIVGTGYCMVCYYDSSDVFISYEIAGSSTVLEYTKKIITVPSNTSRIRISGTTTKTPKLYEYLLVNYDSAEISSVKSSIMYIERLACYVQFEYFGAITIIPIEGQDKNTDYIPFLTTKFMSLQYSLDNSYKSFKDLLNNYKKLNLITNLSLIDIHNFDFFKLKYLKQTGRFYYVNNIQYAYGRLAKCEALEILNFAVNYPPTLNNFTRKVNSIDIATLKEIIISKANFFNNYYDEELDEPLKIKIIDGFNSNIFLYQNGVLITSETEINYSELNLTAVTQVLDNSDYIESWNFNIMDAGSLEYSEEVAVLSVNALAGVDFLGAVKPNANISLKSGETTTIVLGVENRKILTGKNSSYDNYTGIDDNKYYEFVIISKPANSTAYIEENIEDYEGTIVFTGSVNDLGAYVIRLTVTSREGLTGYEDYNLTITEV